MRKPLPHEISSSIVALLTVLLTIHPLSMPTFALFVTWAGTFLQGGPTRQHAVRMVTATTAGAGFGAVAILLDRVVGGMFGDGEFGKTVALSLVVFVMNALMVAAGRLAFFALMPGMFFGFATLFGTYFGGFGFAPGNLAATYVSAAAMCALGPACAFLDLRLMFAPRATTATTTAADDAGPMGEAAPPSTPPSA